MAKKINNQIFTDLSQKSDIKQHNSVVNNKFCQRLKELRLSENLTQKELAIKLGKSRTIVYEWERNGHEPDFDTLIQLTRFFWRYNWLSFRQYRYIKISNFRVRDF